MPKIQLSALATDMKGKSGGSVFARNKGGLYFRNNPSPVQKKSNKWAYQKGNFASVSTKWKGLSDIERTAWENMTVNYPSKDAWGNTYIPSGYQLYMKLNTTLVSNNMSAITVPLMPQEMPEIGELGMYAPEQEAFCPTTGASLMGDGTRMFYLLSQDFLDGRDFSLTNHLSIRLARDTTKFKTWAPNTCATVISLLRKDNVGMFAFVQFNRAGKVSLYVVYNYADLKRLSYSTVSEYDVTAEYKSGNMHLTFAASVTTELKEKLYINGFEATPLKETGYNTFQDPYKVNGTFIGDITKKQQVVPLTSFTATLRVGNYNKAEVPLFIGSDIRYWSSSAMGDPCACSDGAGCPESYDCDGCDCYLVWDDKVSWNVTKYQLIAKGYILGNETSITPLTNFHDGVYQTFTTDKIPSIVLTDDEDCCSPNSDCADFSDQECRDCCCLYVGDSDWVEPRLPVTFSPIVILTPFETILSGFYLSIYCTKPIGLGKSDFNSPKTLIATVPLDGSTVDITEEIHSNFPSVQAASKLVLSYKMINSQTGEAIECKPKPKKPAKNNNPIRFKAGSELSSSVN